MRILTLKQASEYLHLSPRTLHAYSSRKKIPVLKYANKLMFDGDALDAWVLRHRVKAVNETRGPRELRKAVSA
ncbi:MAG: helix-turn-helix domain-containing protein [Acidobacteria bacterium]|nr:helix-turn-helix domain-containing protein [Spirochaetota bacterium]MBE3129234.1 helix-turn-helix domain-containing protein [Acidobacteriota bacterium]